MTVHRLTPPPRVRAPNRANGETTQVQSLTRGLSILECLARAEGGLTLTDIAQRVQLPASTTHRLLATLEKMGYVHPMGDVSRWYVGLAAFTVGSSFLANRDFVAHSVESIGANYIACDVAFGDMTFDEAMRTTTLLGREVIPAFADAERR